MKNAKMISWLLIVVLLIGSMTFPAGAEEEMQLLSIVAVEGETVWVHTSHGLVPFDEDGIQIGESLYPDADCYAIGPEGNIFYSIGGDIFETDKEGEVVDKWLTPMQDFTKILVNDTYILVMSREEYGAIHRKDHMLKGDVIGGVLDIGFYDEDSFLLLREDGGNLLIQVDCATLADMNEDMVSLAQKIAFGSENGMYLYGWKNMYFLDAFGGTQSTYMEFSDIDELADIRLHGENVYAIVNDQLIRYQLQETNVESKVLTVVAGLGEVVDPRLNKAIEIFTGRHPEYTVKMTERPLNAQLKAALMANEPGYDLFVLDSAGSTELKLSGMLMDFSDNEVIAENIAQYMDMPFLWESDGSLYGIPTMVMPQGFAITRALLNEIGTEIGRNWTWDDFFALKDIAKDLGLKLVSDDLFWQVFRRYYESAYCDYIAHEADYDTETFRRLAGMWKALSEEDMINYDPESWNNVLLRHTGMPAAQMENTNGLVYLGMPVLEGEYVTLIDMGAFYVNRYSAEVDAAVEFLEIYSSPEVQFESQGGVKLFLSDLESYTEYPLWQMMNWVPEDEQMEQWKHFLSTGKLQGRNQELDKGVKELVTAYLADEITVDEFALEMQERADLMIGE